MFAPYAERFKGFLLFTNSSNYNTTLTFKILQVQQK